MFLCRKVFSCLPWKAIPRSIFNTAARAKNFFSKYPHRDEDKDCIFQNMCLFWIFNSKAVYICFFLLLFIKPLPPCHDSTESMQVYKQHCKIAEEYHEVKKEIALLEERKWVTSPKYLLLYILLVKSCSKRAGDISLPYSSAQQSLYSTTVRPLVLRMNWEHKGHRAVIALGPQFYRCLLKPSLPVLGHFIT